MLHNRLFVRPVRAVLLQALQTVCKQFTYRLLIYTFAALTISSAFTSVLPLLLYNTSPVTKHLESPLENLSVTVQVLLYMQTSCYCTALTLGVIVTKHLHYMAVDLEYCRGSCVEFWCLQWNPS